MSLATGSDWASRPRTTPMAGRRKATHTWCSPCETLHRTHRHALGEEACPKAPEDRPRGTKPHIAAVRLRSLAPKSPFNPGNRK